MQVQDEDKDQDEDKEEDMDEDKNKDEDKPKNGGYEEILNARTTPTGSNTRGKSPRIGGGLDADPVLL